MDRAFVTICKCISDECELTVPLPEDCVSLVTDAAGGGIGGVLQVKRDGH